MTANELPGCGVRPARRLGFLAAVLRPGLMALAISLGVVFVMPNALARSLASAAAGRVLQLRLPSLSGSSPVGTISLRLVDHSRPDRSFPSGHRELMVQIWYPAASTAGLHRASYMPPRAAKFVEHQAGLPTGTISRIVVHAYQGAPAAAGRRAVLLYSPGSGNVRSASTTLLENLASEGFVVVAIDHTHEADVVEFPGAHLVTGTFVDTGSASNTRELAVRVADTRFVLGELRRIGRSGLLRNRLNLSAIGMFGHSLGGATAAATMLVDHSIRVGADLDGSLYGPVASEGLARPFLFMGVSMPRPDFPLDPSMRSFYAHLRGPRVGLQLAGGAHQTFTDLALFKRQLPSYVAVRIGNVGTIDPILAERTTTKYLSAFFERYLLHRPRPLLRGTDGPGLKPIGAMQRRAASGHPMHRRGITS